MKAIEKKENLCNHGENHRSHLTGHHKEKPPSNAEDGFSTELWFVFRLLCLIIVSLIDQIEEHACGTFIAKPVIRFAE